MADKTEKRGWLPKHLRSLFPEDDAHVSDETLASMLPEEGQSIKTGRVGRAIKMSRLAIGGGGKWLLGKARNSIAGEDSEGLRSRLQNIELARQMLQTFSEMRGISMKLGQMMSYMDDFMPEEGRRILALLQRDAPAMPYDDIAAIVKQELGGAPEEVFATFSKEPIAAASIGQVHRATLPDGTQVAVKVQYPGIEEAMRADLKNARVLNLFQKMFFFSTDAKAIMQELEERFLDECNYEQEADYQDTFFKRFEGHPSIVVPKVFRDFSTKRILTTRFEEGMGFYEWMETNPTPEQRETITRAMYRFYIGSLYLDGLFNADPHPGNYIFREDGKIVFLDYGCCRPFPLERRKLWVKLCRAVYTEDFDTVHELGVSMGFFKEGTKYNRDAFIELMQYLYRPYLKDDIFDFALQRPETTFRNMFVENPNLFKLNMPPDAVFLNRIGFGLVSIMTEFGARLNCRQHIGQYFEGIDPDWPEDPTLQGPEPHPLVAIK
jgi:predicted unusual protein kinase regulating ubiquinone biosynthesis (AarF/ABC1/UbiB family)